MKFQWLLALALVAATAAVTAASSALMAGPASKDEYPAAVEGRLKRELGLTLGGVARGASYRACLLTPEEAIVEVALEDAEIGGTDVLALARQRVNDLLSREFPGVQLSELSSFRLLPPPAGQLVAMRPARQS